MYDYERLLKWVVDQRNFSYVEIEVLLGIPHGVLGKWVRGVRQIPEKYVEGLWDLMLKHPIGETLLSDALDSLIASNASMVKIKDPLVIIHSENVGIEGKTGIVESVGFGGRVDVTVDATRPVTFTGFGVSKFNEMLAEFEGLTSGLGGVGDIVGEVKKKLIDFRGKADGCGLLNFRQRDSLMGRVDNIMRGNWSPWKVYKKAV